MSDPIPPTGDKKPRRAAPRKRAPAKRAEKPDATAGEGKASADAKGSVAPAKKGAPASKAVPTAKAPRSGRRRARPPQAAAAGPDVANAARVAEAAQPGTREREPEAAPATVAAAQPAILEAAGDRIGTHAAAPPAAASLLPSFAELDAVAARNVVATPTDAATAAPATAELARAGTAPDFTPAAAAADAGGEPREREARRDPRSSPPAGVEAPRPAPAAPAPVVDLTPKSLRPGELIRVPLSVRWRDLDAFNHVNNSKYLSYLEEARLRWMLTLPGMGLDESVAPVVAASNLNYRRPIGWPADVVVELFVERLGSTSVTVGHRIIDAAEGGVTYCDGNVVMVWIDRVSGRASPLPDSVRAACTRR